MYALFLVIWYDGSDTFDCLLLLAQQTKLRRCTYVLCTVNRNM